MCGLASPLPVIVVVLGFGDRWQNTVQHGSQDVADAEAVFAGERADLVCSLV